MYIISISMALPVHIRKNSPDNIFWGIEVIERENESCSRAEAVCSLIPFTNLTVHFYTISLSLSLSLSLAIVSVSETILHTCCCTTIEQKHPSHWVSYSYTQKDSLSYRIWHPTHSLTTYVWMPSIPIS